MNARSLTDGVVNVMADVLVHQRVRWGALLGHKRQLEGWWKAEMVQAIESWTWTLRKGHASWPADVCAEARPAKFDVPSGPPLADIVVARLRADLEDFDYEATPRLWIELKGRATWWGTTPGRAAKAFGTANNGILSDLARWRRVKDKGNVVLACQVTTYEGTWAEPHLPKTWRDELAYLESKYERAIKPRCVGYEIPKTEDGHDVRWARFDAFIVNRGW